MNLVEDKIVHLLTGKHNLFEVSVDELQAISDEQPFFSVAQLSLTQKMKQVNHPGFVQQLQKTALFFPNIFWLDKHLQESSPQGQQAVAPSSPAAPTQQPSFETPISTPASNTATATSYNTATNAVPEPPAAPSFTASSDSGYYDKEDENDMNPITAQYGQQEVAETVTETSPEELLTAVTDRIDEPVTEQPTEAPVAAAWEEQAAHIAVNEDLAPTPEPEYPSYTAPVIEEVTGDTPTSVEVIADPVTAPYVAPEPEAAATPPVMDASVEAEAPAAALAQDTQELSTGYEHAIKESFAYNTGDDFSGDDEDDLPVDALGETGDDMEAPPLRLAEIMQQQANTFHKPVAENEVLPIESEPYHTVDYFASQGIKAESNVEDGLAKKVRKFTDWLKQMKKVAPLPSDLGTDAELEKVVHGIAATSIEAKEVVTEAMAEVLVKQGRIDKAVLLYSKLSFLNPDKTAYFAAKILELKGN